MEFKIVDRLINEVDCDVLVVGKYEDVPLEGDALKLDQAMDGLVSYVVDAEDFKGKEGKCLLLYTMAKIKPSRVAVAGLGKKDKTTLDTFRKAAGTAAAKSKETNAKHIAFPVSAHEQFSAEDIAQAVVEGVGLAAYSFDRHKEKKDENHKTINTVSIIGKKTKELKTVVTVGENLFKGTNFARDIVNEPANIMNTEGLAEIAMKLANEEGITCKIYGQEEMEAMGMGAALAVAKGSANPPRFIHLTYTPQGTASGRTALVGKGLTFDSGGLNIKIGEHMRFMKCDKSGACTVLGVFSALPKLKPDKEVHGIIAAVENMPGSKAMRPDDILVAMNGKTIEVLNTDAEGRLTLADALSYAVKLKPDKIVDLATLTGSCMVALGEYAAGVMGNNQEFIDELLKVAELAGERMWQLPFHDELRDKLKSDVADLKNIGGRYGGTITAGMFLEPFVNSIPWVHIDIAGPAFNEKGWSYNPKGATGFGVRTLLRYLIKS